MFHKLSRLSIPGMKFEEHNSREGFAHSHKEMGSRMFFETLSVLETYGWSKLYYNEKHNTIMQWVNKIRAHVEEKNASRKLTWDQIKWLWYNLLFTVVIFV